MTTRLTLSSRIVFVAIISALLALTASRANAALIAINGGSLGVINIDPATGLGVRISIHDHSENFRGLAYAPDKNTLYGVDPGGTLLTVNPFTGKTTVIGELGFDRIRGLAYVPATQTLYASHTGGTPELLTVNTTTGVATSVASTTSAAFGLAYHPELDVLLGTDIFGETLTSYDPATGSESSITVTGFDNVTGLTYDPVTKTLFGTDNVSDELLSIDPSTGIGTVIGSLNFGDISNLAYVDLDAIPEPSSLLAVASGLLAILKRRRVSLNSYSS